MNPLTVLRIAAADVCGYIGALHRTFVDALHDYDDVQDTAYWINATADALAEAEEREEVFEGFGLKLLFGPKTVPATDIPSGGLDRPAPGVPPFHAAGPGAGHPTVWEIACWISDTAQSLDIPADVANKLAGIVATRIADAVNHPSREQEAGL